MVTKFTYKNEVGRKWDVGSGTHPTQKIFLKKANSQPSKARTANVCMYIFKKNSHSCKKERRGTEDKRRRNRGKETKKGKKNRNSGIEPDKRDTGAVARC
jgi:hypothetical protein